MEEFNKLKYEEYKIKRTKLPRKLKKKLKKEHKIHLTAYYKSLCSINKIVGNLTLQGEE